MKKEDFAESHPILRTPKTFEQKAADGLTKHMGSWTFLTIFLLFLIIWMLMNIYAWMNAWDPYPFILLNLLLSCLAAIQAPIILMSQNREQQKERLKIEYDYRINKKAEEEIRELKKQLTRIETHLLEKKQD